MHANSHAKSDQSILKGESGAIVTLAALIASPIHAAMPLADSHSHTHSLAPSDSTPTPSDHVLTCLLPG